MDESDARVTLIEALDEKKVSLAELDQFYPLKVELDKLGIPVEDLRRTTEIIQGAQKSGYSVKTITHLLSTLETSSAIQARIEKNIEDLTDKRDNLEEEVENSHPLIDKRNCYLDNFETWTLVLKN